MLGQRHPAGRGGVEGELPHAPSADARQVFRRAARIGAGLALGREGPSVQMGAASRTWSAIVRRNWPDCRVLLAAGAGAGLATAFNAPIAGAVFVLEELMRRFETRTAIAALGASAARLPSRGFSSAPLPISRAAQLCPASRTAALLSLGRGCRPARHALQPRAARSSAGRRLGGWPVELRAARRSARRSERSWFAPALVGGGERSPSACSPAEARRHAPTRFALRSARRRVVRGGTPGGFCARCSCSARRSAVRRAWLALACRMPAVEPDGFAVVGMAAFFTGVVRAPVTGIVLVTEMTAIHAAAADARRLFVAMLVPSCARRPDLYLAARANIAARPQRLEID